MGVFIRSITVTSITLPDEYFYDETDYYTIGGTGFQSGAQVRFIRQDYGQTLEATGESVTNPTSMTCTVDHDLLAGIRSGSMCYTIRVTNPDSGYGELYHGYYTYEIW